MSFTAAELAEMAAADAEIEAEFALTAEEIRASRDLDRFAALSAKDNKQRSIAEYQRRYRAANKEAIAEYQRQYRAAKKGCGKMQQLCLPPGVGNAGRCAGYGADCPRFGTDECQQMDRRTQNGR